MKTPKTIPELYEALMGQFAKLKKEMNQGFIQVNQRIQELCRRVEKLEGNPPERTRRSESNRTEGKPLPYHATKSE